MPIMLRHMAVDLNVRFRRFAIRIIGLYEALPRHAVSRTIGKQLLRSGIGAGAHYSEAIHARSNDEFTAKLDLALQELSETSYWLDLLVEAAVISSDKLALLQQEARELRAILVSISKRVKAAPKGVSRGAAKRNVESQIGLNRHKGAAVAEPDF
jgi:four helix bundle protein